MSIYSNGLPGQLEFPDAVRSSRPLIRPVPNAAAGTDRSRPVGGRVFTAGLNAQGVPDHAHRQVRLTVTERGHWYRSDDPADDPMFGPGPMCRGCYGVNSFGAPCPRPASHQDVATALLGQSRPGPAPMRARQPEVRFDRSEVAA